MTATRRIALPSASAPSATTPVPSLSRSLSASSRRILPSPCTRAASTFAPATSFALRGEVARLRRRDLRGGLLERALELLHAPLRGLDLLRHLERAGAEQRRRAPQLLRLALRELDRLRAGDGDDAADARGDRLLARDLEEADVAGAADVRAAAELLRRARCARRAPRRRTSRRRSPSRPPGAPSRSSSTAVSVSAFSRTSSLTRRSTPASSSSVSGWKCEKSKRRWSGATSEPVCFTCSPSTSRSARCSRCVAEWFARMRSRRRVVHRELDDVADRDRARLDDADVRDEARAPAAARRCTSTVPLRSGDRADVADLAAGLAVERRRGGDDLDRVALRRASRRGRRSR